MNDGKQKPSGSLMTWRCGVCQAEFAGYWEYHDHLFEHPEDELPW